VHRRSVALDVRLEPEVAARDHHRHAVVAERAREEHTIPRLHPIGADVDAGSQGPDARGVHVQAVGVAALDHLGVAGRDRDACGLCGPGHVTGDPAEIGDREALLDHEAGGKPERHRAGDGQVVDRAVHRQIADRSARKEDRLDDVGVGREREPRALELDQGRVAERLEHRVPELLEEKPLDERARRLPTRAVRERDDVVSQLHAFMATRP